MSNTKSEKLHYALQELNDNLILWGIDNTLGVREDMTSIKVESKGATNLVELVNTLNAEIRRLNAIVEELEQAKK
jgi:hypothetical protein